MDTSVCGGLLKRLCYCQINLINGNISEKFSFKNYFIIITYFKKCNIIIATF